MRTINKKIKIQRFLIAGILIIMLSSFVIAIGVSCTYSVKNPLEMYPGEKKTVSLGLQNPDVEGEIIAGGTLLKGSEIASLDEETYKVPYQATDVYAKLKIKIPKDVVVGQEYDIQYEFRPVAGEEAGDLGAGSGAAFTTGAKRSFKVIVIPEPAETATPEGTNTWLWWVLGIVLLVLIVWIILKSKKKTKKKK